MLRQVHPNGSCAILFNENYGLIFVSFLDYYTDLYNSKNFEVELTQHRHFDVFVIPNEKHYTGDWRAIFARPVKVVRTSLQKVKLGRKVNYPLIGIAATRVLNGSECFQVHVR